MQVAARRKSDQIDWKRVLPGKRIVTKERWKPVLMGLVLAREWWRMRGAVDHAVDQSTGLVAAVAAMIVDVDDNRSWLSREDKNVELKIHI